MSFSENVKTARKAKNLTQQELADIMNLSRSTIAKYETTDSYPHAKNIFKLCEIFELSIDELLK